MDDVLAVGLRIKSHHVLLVGPNPDAQLVERISRPGPSLTYAGLSLTRELRALNEAGRLYRWERTEWSRELLQKQKYTLIIGVNVNEDEIHDIAACSVSANIPITIAGRADIGAFDIGPTLSSDLNELRATSVLNSDAAQMVTSYVDRALAPVLANLEWRKILEKLAEFRTLLRRAGLSENIVERNEKQLLSQGFDEILQLTHDQMEGIAIWLKMSTPKKLPHAGNSQSSDNLRVIAPILSPAVSGRAESEEDPTAASSTTSPRSADEASAQQSGVDSLLKLAGQDSSPHLFIDRSRMTTQYADVSVVPESPYASGAIQSQILGQALSQPADTQDSSQSAANIAHGDAAASSSQPSSSLQLMQDTRDADDVHPPNEVKDSPVGELRGKKRGRHLVKKVTDNHITPQSRKRAMRRLPPAPAQDPTVQHRPLAGNAIVGTEFSTVLDSQSDSDERPYLMPMDQGRRSKRNESIPPEPVKSVRRQRVGRHTQSNIPPDTKLLDATLSDSSNAKDHPHAKSKLGSKAALQNTSEPSDSPSNSSGSHCDSVQKSSNNDDTGTSESKDHASGNRESEGLLTGLTRKLLGQ